VTTASPSLSDLNNLALLPKETNPLDEAETLMRCMVFTRLIDNR